MPKEITTYYPFSFFFSNRRFEKIWKDFRFFVGGPKRSTEKWWYNNFKTVLSHSYVGKFIDTKKNRYTLAQLRKEAIESYCFGNCCDFHWQIIVRLFSLMQSLNRNLFKNFCWFDEETDQRNNFRFKRIPNFRFKRTPNFKDQKLTWIFQTSTSLIFGFKLLNLKSIFTVRFKFMSIVMLLQLSQWKSINF